MQIKTKKVKLFIVSMLFLGLSANLEAQRGSTSIDLLGGYAENGYGVLFNYNYHLSRNDFIQASVYFSSATIKKNDIDIPHNTFTVNVGYFNSVYTSNRRNINLNIGGGILMGYEVVNNANNTLPSGALILDDSKFIYGGFISGEIDIYLSDDFSVLVKGNGYYHLNSDLGNFTLFAGAGFRYFIY